MAPLLSCFCLGCKRCCDRKCGTNETFTTSRSQAEYEDLYTGPEFVLQIRYAQLLTMIFFVFTFSSAIPYLYAVLWVIFLFTYLVDKCLLLRFYRLTPGHTKRMSQGVLSLLPWAVVLHFLFGLVAYSNPLLLKSEVNDAFSFGYGEFAYFNVQKLG